MEEVKKDSMMKYKYESWRDFFTLSLIIFGVYFITLRFIFPGYFNPLIPFHSDFYMFYPASPHETLNSLFMSPRFVGIFVRDIVGMFGMKSTIIFLITLNSINIALTILLAKAVTKMKLYWPAIILYLFLIFSHPGFYIKYSYDFFDALAYFFTVLTMYLWYKNGEMIENKYLLILVLVTFLGLFSKETYFVPLLIFWCYQCFFINKKQKQSAFVMLGATVIIFILSILHSHFVNSAWVNIGSSRIDSYFIDAQPSSIIETYLYYLKMWGNFGIIGMVAIVAVVSIVSKRYFKEVLLFLIIGLSTYVPYSLLPNHKFACYFWLAVPLSYSVILFINPDMIRLTAKKINDSSGKLYKGALAFFVLLIIFFGIIAFKQFNDAYNDAGLQWTLLQESINQNMLANFPYIKNNISPSDKVLLTGLTFPFHPFAYPNYVDSYFGDSQNMKWTVAVYDDANKDKNIGSIEFVNVKKIDISKYEKIFVFDSNGKLIKMTAGGKVDLSVSDQGVISQNDVILYPELNNYTGVSLKNDDWNSYMLVGNILANIDPSRGEYFLNKSIQFSKETNPYPYYFMGKLMEKLHRNEDALYNYSKAVELDSEKTIKFTAAVKRVKKILK